MRANIAQHLSSTMKMNIYFKIQLMLIPVFVVAGQNFRIILSMTLISLQILGIILFIVVKKSTQFPVFESPIHFLSYFFIMAVISLLALNSIVLQEWHTIEYRKIHSKTIDDKGINDLLSTAVIALLVSSIVTEIIKAFVSI